MSVKEKFRLVDGTIDAKTAFETLKKEMALSEREFDFFCKRYYQRSVKTLCSYFSDFYGIQLPRGFGADLQAEIAKHVESKN